MDKFGTKRQKAAGSASGGLMHANAAARSGGGVLRRMDAFWCGLQKKEGPAALPFYLFQPIILATSAARSSWRFSMPSPFSKRR